MDSKQLFHNPDSLTDTELASIRYKLAVQKRSAVLGMIGGGLFAVIMRRAVFKH
jgi:hypothetical protein